MKVFMSALRYENPQQLAEDLRRLAHLVENEPYLDQNGTGYCDGIDYDYQIEEFDCVSLSAMFNDYF